MAAWLAIGFTAGCAGPASPPPVEKSGRLPELRVHADEGLSEIADRIGSEPSVWTSMPGIADTILAGRTVNVWFVHDLSTLDSLGIGTREPWVAGIADPGRRLIGLRVDGAQRNLSRLLAVYRHEAAHVALHAATGGNVPTWLQEGYAQTVSGTWDWNDGWRLQFALLDGGQSILADLDRGFRSDYQPQTAYILSYTAVQTLRSLGGDAGLSALFADLRAGASFDAALRRVYGITRDGFEERWREQVLDRYGWLYLLSRTAFLWLTVTLLIVGLGIARVRRDRRRLAEMRERERREEAAALARLIESRRDEV